MWGAACVECEEGGEAAGGRLHTAMALLGLKVLTRLRSNRETVSRADLGFLVLAVPLTRLPGAWPPRRRARSDVQSSMISNTV